MRNHWQRPLLLYVIVLQVQLMLLVLLSLLMLLLLLFLLRSVRPLRLRSLQRRKRWPRATQVFVPTTPALHSFAPGATCITIIFCLSNDPIPHGNVGAMLIVGVMVCF